MGLRADRRRGAYRFKRALRVNATLPACEAFYDSGASPGRTAPSSDHARFKSGNIYGLARAMRVSSQAKLTGTSSGDRLSSKLAKKVERPLTDFFDGSTVARHNRFNTGRLRRDIWAAVVGVLFFGSRPARNAAHVFLIYHTLSGIRDHPASQYRQAPCNCRLDEKESAIQLRLGRVSPIRSSEPCPARAF